MTNFSFAEASPVLQQLNRRMENLKPTPLFFFKYLNQVLKTQWDAAAPTYPMEIKIAPSNAMLLKKKFDPEKIIRIEEPLHREDGSPMWFEETKDQAWLRFGYKNEDPRFMSDEKFDMEYIHGFLGGSSGHGKSVTINSMLASLFYEYPPWELQVEMSDAKIIEFKKYGVGYRIPHIATIAATEDPEYVLSMLERDFQQMNERGKIFANIGASNLKSFRKKTGLAYPRVLIVMDEVESTFKMAGKYANRIAELIDGFARLGRAAGYHVFMATQNMSADIPKSATGQIRNRMCLGATESVSDAIIGNIGAAENFGRIGKLIVNTQTLNGGDTTPHNVQYQTPFLTDDNFEQEMRELSDLGDKVGFRWKLAFYDEEDIKTVDEFQPVIDKAITRMVNAGEMTAEKQIIPIGYPAFVSNDTDELLKLTFDHRDVENIAICSTVSDNVSAMLRVLDCGLRHDWQMIHYSSDVDQLASVPHAIQSLEAREAAQKPLSTMAALVHRRLFLLYVDNLAKDEGALQFNREQAEQMMLKCGVPKEMLGNGLMCRRAFIFSIVQTAPEHATIWKTVSSMFPSFLKYYEECVKYNAIIEPVTISKFKKVAIFIGDLSKIVGYGRDTKSAMVTALKKMMLDCNRAGVIMILYSRSMEGLNELSTAVRYTLFDVPDGKDWGRMRVDPPGSLNARLIVLSDTMNTVKPTCKFKRTLLRPEF